MRYPKLPCLKGFWGAPPNCVNYAVVVVVLAADRFLFAGDRVALVHARRHMRYKNSPAIAFKTLQLFAQCFVCCPT
jgi:hypothetical protein